MKKIFLRETYRNKQFTISLNFGVSFTDYAQLMCKKSVEKYAFHVSLVDENI